jgi:hypothetical protein
MREDGFTGVRAFPCKHALLFMMGGLAKGLTNDMSFMSQLRRLINLIDRVNAEEINNYL